MNKVILVWEEVPESTKVYSLFVSNEDLTRLTRCHGKFINSDDFDGDDQDWLVKFGEKLSEDFQIFPTNITLTTMVSSEVEGVLIVTGWIL